MKVGKLLVFAAVLGLTAGAGAATVHTGTNFLWDITTPAPVGSGAENLVAFQLTVVNTSGNPAKNPQAFDGAPDPNNPPGQTGIETPAGSLLHHEQASGGFGHTPSPDADYWAAGPLGASPLDSYFLQTNPASVFAPTEDDINLHLPLSAETPFYFPNPPYAFDCGWTDKLQGTFAMQGSNPNVYWNLAYLVVPCGTDVRVDAQVAGSDGVKEDFDFTFTVSCAPIPVPAALPLGFAGLLLAIRRRVA
jgi:uncharacterized protein (TIGR03382 family)